MNPIGISWGIISLVSSILISIGFYLPFWIEGELLGSQRTFFGSFHRCGYPQLTESGVIEMLGDCGRYSSFWTIPSGWWRVSTILIGTGAVLSLITCVTIVMSTCFREFLNPTSSRIIGIFQLLAGLLISGGLVIFPLGWDNPEVFEACSEQSAPYHLGTCRISWSIYMMTGGVVLLLTAFILSTSACRTKKGTYRI